MIDLATLTDDELEDEYTHASAAYSAEHESKDADHRAREHYFAVLGEQQTRKARDEGFSTVEAWRSSPAYRIQTLKAASNHLANAAYLLEHADEIDNDPVARARSLYSIGRSLLDSFNERDAETFWGAS